MLYWLISLTSLIVTDFPRVRLSTAIVHEIVAGIVLGPSVLGWIKIDLPISILSVLGLAFLLFLAGLEVELERLRGRLLMYVRSEEHTSELQSHLNLVCRLLLEKKKEKNLFY